MASERWKDDIAYAMTPIKLITWPIGVWPLQVYNFYSILRSIFGICLSGIVMILPPIEVYMGCTNAEKSVDSIMFTFAGLLGVLKTIWFRIYANNLINNYKSAVKDYIAIKNVEERIIMRKHVFMSRIASFPLLFCSYYAAVVFTLTALMMNHDERNVTDENMMLEYPLPSKCTLKYFHAPTSMYKIFFIIQSMSLIIVSNCNKGSDALFINIILHICGQMKILRSHFANVDATNSQIYDRFKKLIQRHIYLIEMTRKLVDVMSFILLLELFITSICLCVMGFQFIVALKEKDVVKMAQSLMVQIVFLVTLSVYSFIGRYLKSQMEDIGYSIYQIAWYEFPMKLTRNLVFIFMQTEGPAMLQAGNFIVYVNCDDLQYKEKSERAMYFHFGQTEIIIYNRINVEMK
ncbi:odorant receptor 13a-like [Camponotus floridanus]|uniref:odorant receptor 13a-like n=1 Tax=Camponotus floridanus TaxID=104421 RepID=UPI0009716A08|nr:odorant receptor 13a-like [Camponotus floridanus]